MTEIVARRRRGRSTTTSSQRESDARLPRRHAAVRQGRDSSFTSHYDRARRRAGAQRPQRPASTAKGAECTLNGLFVGPRHAARRQPHRRSTTPSRTARAASSTRESWTGVARRLQRQDHRPAGRAEDRRDPDEPEPAPLRRGAGRHQAAARDPRRRRQVRARRDDRAARRRARSSTCARAASARRSARDLLIYAFAERGRSSASRSRRSASGLEARLQTRLPGPADASGRARMSTALAEPCRGRRPPPRRRPRSARDFPILARRGARQAARLPRQRGDDPEAAGRHRRRSRRVLRARQRQHPPRRALALSDGDRRVRGGAREGAALPQRAPRAARSSSSAARPRRSTSSPQTSAGSTSAPGDEVLITALEHHSNIVPWQMLCEETGARLRVAADHDAASPIVDEFERLLTPRTQLVAVAHVSNALGTINPVRQIVELAHARGVPVAGRRRAGGAAPRRRRAGARLRLLRLLRPQALRPDRHRRPLRARRSCSRRCRPSRAAAT